VVQKTKKKKLDHSEIIYLVMSTLLSAILQ
jgi:predicted membrane channel-forming protein YqfA (hemolysin III family)